MNFIFFIGIFTFFLVSRIVRAVKLTDHSFEPPFKLVDERGDRVVSTKIHNFGTTVVNQNFIRLTPDRQSKKGKDIKILS